jgi:hypothetical protein
MDRMIREPAANIIFAKAGVSCFYESEVLNSSFVHLMKFCAKNPRLRTPKRTAHHPTQPTERTDAKRLKKME